MPSLVHQLVRSSLHPLLAGTAIALLASPAGARPKDDEASELVTEAMSDDYANGRYLTARKKLERAIRKCGKRRCSRSVASEAYRYLGLVEFELGRKQRARDAFERAVELDPSGRLDPNWATPAVLAAFERAGGTIDDDQADYEEDDAEYEDSEHDESAEDESEEADSAGSRSWLSLSAQQDWWLYGETRPVCGGPGYTCFDRDGEYTGPIWPGYGNKVSGGLGLATTRVLLGFEQVLGDHVALGVRFGFAFRGGPTLRGGEDFLPFHAEARLAYYFGSAPFADAGVRPYLALGGGLGEVRSRIDVDYYKDATAYNEARKETLEAWRSGGRAFLAPTFGGQFAFSPTFALTAELRWMAMVGGSGSAPAASLGLALGL